MPHGYCVSGAQWHTPDFIYSALRDSSQGGSTDSCQQSTDPGNAYRTHCAPFLSPLTSHSHCHTLTITRTCCYDEIKGTQDLKIYSHAYSLILSFSLTFSLLRDAVTGVGKVAYLWRCAAACLISVQNRIRRVGLRIFGRIRQSSASASISLH